MAESRRGRIPSDAITPDQAALLLDVTADHVRHLLRLGTLAGWQDRRRWWVCPRSVRTYVHDRALGIQRRAAVEGGSSC